MKYLLQLVYITACVFVAGGGPSSNGNIFLPFCLLSEIVKFPHLVGNKQYASNKAYILTHRWMKCKIAVEDDGMVVGSQMSEVLSVAGADPCGKQVWTIK